jgi:hypothetical protein
MSHIKPLCRCGNRATMVVDVRTEFQGPTVERRLACDGCASRLRCDPIVERKDLSAVLGTGTCWCDSSRHLNIRLEICPRHGRWPIHLET